MPVREGDQYYDPFSQSSAPEQKPEKKKKKKVSEKPEPY